ncbi:hypothetical protein [Mesorhizobium sp. KR1-2]|uniref:hypothetical protein n=1 Tax=Mesorhizobium sp. KR1-2 TaxID=3156609 RepID=UPI0032B33E3E
MYPSIVSQSEFLESLRAEAGRRAFYPTGAVRCIGSPLFRNQAARNLGCLLDVDTSVLSWACLPLALRHSQTVHVPDFLVQRADGPVLVDALSGEAPSWIAEEAAAHGLRYLPNGLELMGVGFRLENARDLLRYVRWQCPLGDRVRVLSALDEHGTASVAEILSVFREILPMAGLASLILHRFVEIELDETQIGPDTSIRRWRD